MPSYYARYESADGRPLLGGVMWSMTCRYGTRLEAEERLRAVVEVNGGPGRCRGTVEKDKSYPEIFVHCGTVAQCIGCQCHGCGKKLRVKDAKEHGKDK